jgi:prolyl oligopeptidase
LEFKLRDAVEIPVFLGELTVHRKNGFALFLLTSSALVVACSQGRQPAGVNYPDTASIDHVDIYHGREVADPYRWLEDDVRESEAVKAWVDAQNEVTFAYLGTIPERERIAKRMRELWDYETFSLPTKAGGRYFYRHNTGLQNQDVIFMQASLNAEPEMLIDPNSWSDDGTIALAGYYPSNDGRYVAYTIQDGGSDWRVARVMNVETGDVLDDHLEWLKFTGLSWTADGNGFYYSRYPATSTAEKYQSLNKDMKVYYHRIGTSQDEDEIAYERPDKPDWGPRGTVTDDGRHLVITISIGTDDRYSIVHQDLTNPESEPIMIIEGFDYDYALVGSVGDELYFRTNNGAPKNRLITIDPFNPQPENWGEVIPEAEDVLDSVNLVGGRIVAEYMQDAWSVVKIFELDGTEASVVNLPGIGTASGFRGKVDDPETFFSYESFNLPDTINRLDVTTGEVEVFKKPDVAFDPDDYQVEQVFYTSKDDTRVPMFISYRKDVVPDGNRPTMLYGYGGFNISQQPVFRTTRLAWMEMGGIYAVANLRGGGEYGEEWHQAGTKLNKQNVFDDFIAAAEYLIENNYTNPKKLAIFGGSNGGLLVGAVTNQRPELFGVAIPAVGVMDMLRFHHFTAGRFWTDDYGSSDNPDEFAALRAYSPYHNVRNGAVYPAVLVTTADFDDRVVPGHSFKYAAAMQKAQGGPAPVLIRIETRSGHGAGAPTDKVIADYADRWAFLVRNLDMRLPEGYGE